MDLINGLLYNLRGLKFAVKDAGLLFLGLARFILVIAVMFLLTGLILAHHRELMEILWTRPESVWIVWLWHLVSWLVSLFLVGVSAVLSYLISQVLFSVIIMDYMSRITERRVTGSVREPEGVSILRTFLFLIRQEIPRAILPVLISLIFMVLGWVTALLGPLMVIVSSCLAVIFLSWDNTDLTPARRQMPFRERWRLLLKGILFHLGFGLPFLIPGLNLIFLSYAPVGATLYYLERHDRTEWKPGKSADAPDEVPKVPEA